MVAEIGVTGRGDVNGGAEGDERESEEVEWWRGGLITESKASGLGGGVEGEGGGHGVAVCVGVWKEVGDVDSEFGTEEEGEEG